MNLGKVVVQGKSQTNLGRMKSDGLVKPALVGWLRSKYGENSPIADIKDARILSMRDVLKEKKGDLDTESILGEGWRFEVDDTSDIPGPTRFNLTPRNSNVCNDDQSLIFLDSGKVVLATKAHQHVVVMEPDGATYTLGTTYTPLR